MLLMMENSTNQSKIFETTISGNLIRWWRKYITTYVTHRRLYIILKYNKHIDTK